MPPPLLTTIDRQSGIRTRVIRDAETGLPVIVTRQDTTPILDDNKRTASMFDKNANFGRPRQVANIPNVIWLWLKERGYTRDSKRLRKFLSRPDMKWLRTDDGRPLA
jgi:hypothetical protein